MIRKQDDRHPKPKRPLVTLSPKEQKQVQREEAFARRRAIAPGEAGAEAARQFLSTIKFSHSDIISLYWPLGTELETGPLLRALHNRGAHCALPVIEGQGRPLIFRRWEPDTVLEPGPFKALVPTVEAEILVPTIVLTPMLAFDAAGYRLGYGGGFYDRTLHKLRQGGGPRAVGFAYAAQEVDKVVTDAFDERLDWIVTERYVRKIE